MNMYKVEANIRPDKFDEVRAALHEIDVTMITKIECRGSGRLRAAQHSFRQPHCKARQRISHPLTKTPPYPGDSRNAACVRGLEMPWPIDSSSRHGPKTHVSGSPTGAATRALLLNILNDVMQ